MSNGSGRVVTVVGGAAAAQRRGALARAWRGPQGLELTGEEVVLQGLLRGHAVGRPVLHESLDQVCR